MKIVDKVSIDTKGWWIDLSSVHIGRFEAVRFISDFETDGELIEIVDAKDFSFGPEMSVDKEKSRVRLPKWLRENPFKMKELFVLVETDEDGKERVFITKAT